jgi:hypothetical protein
MLLLHAFYSTAHCCCCCTCSTAVLTATQHYITSHYQITSHTHTLLLLHRNSLLPLQLFFLLVLFSTRSTACSNSAMPLTHYFLYILYSSLLVRCTLASQHLSTATRHHAQCAVHNCTTAGAVHLQPVGAVTAVLLQRCMKCISRQQQ